KLPIECYSCYLDDKIIHTLNLSITQYTHETNLHIYSLDLKAEVIFKRYFLFVTIVNGNLSFIWFSLSLLLVYRNACVFCTLILYPESLLKLLISFRNFWAEAMGSSRYTIMSSANRDNLASSFPI
uniref:Uncharacterized protein n=1 Tax=Callithrix jacchus TaxID=9483 RepID=A0A5F4W4J4_CALJA